MHGLSGSVKAVGLDAYGGLVGWAGSTGTAVAISEVYAEKSVTTTDGAANVGGLIGNMSGGATLTDAYARVVVNAGGATSINVGGLVGNVSDATDSITNTYASGVVTDGATASTGALIGTNSGGTITQSFYDKTVNSGLTGIGGTADVATHVEGKTTAELQDGNTFLDAGWDIVTDSGLSSADSPTLAYGNGSQAIRSHKWEIKTFGTGTGTGCRRRCESGRHKPT